MGPESVFAKHLAVHGMSSIYVSSAARTLSTKAPGSPRVPNLVVNGKLWTHLFASWCVLPNNPTIFRTCRCGCEHVLSQNGASLKAVLKDIKAGDPRDPPVLPSVHRCFRGVTTQTPDCVQHVASRKRSMWTWSVRVVRAWDPQGNLLTAGQCKTLLFCPEKTQ